MLTDLPKKVNKRAASGDAALLLLYVITEQSGESYACEADGYHCVEEQGC